MIKYLHERSLKTEYGGKMSITVVYNYEKVIPALEKVEEYVNGYVNLVCEARMHRNRGAANVAIFGEATQVGGKHLFGLINTIHNERTSIGYITLNRGSYQAYYFGPEKEKLSFFDIVERISQIWENMVTAGNEVTIPITIKTPEMAKSAYELFTIKEKPHTLL